MGPCINWVLSAVKNQLWVACTQLKFKGFVCLYNKKTGSEVFSRTGSASRQCYQRARGFSICLFACSHSHKVVTAVSDLCADKTVSSKQERYCLPFVPLIREESVSQKPPGDFFSRVSLARIASRASLKAALATGDNESHFIWGCWGLPFWEADISTETWSHESMGGQRRPRRKIAPKSSGSGFQRW